MLNKCGPVKKQDAALAAQSPEIIRPLRDVKLCFVKYQRCWELRYESERQGFGRNRADLKHRGRYGTPGAFLMKSKYNKYKASLKLSEENKPKAFSVYSSSVNASGV